jgi:hypothetical protein
MNSNQPIAPPATTGESPAEGGIRTPDPRITNGCGLGLGEALELGLGRVGNTRGEHPGLRLLAMPSLDGKESQTLADFMGARADECIKTIMGRVDKAMQVNGGEGFTRRDLKAMLRDAFVAGGRGMCDGLAERESAGALERLDAIEREVERARIRMAVKSAPIGTLPWPSSGSVMDQVVAHGKEGAR